MLKLCRQLSRHIVDLVTVYLSDVFTDNMIIIVLLLKEAGIGIGLPLELREVPPTVRKLYVEFRLNLLADVGLNLVLLGLQDIPIGHIVRHVSQRHKVASTEPHKDPLLLFVCVLIEHGGQVGYLIVSTASDVHQILRYLTLIGRFHLIHNRARQVEHLQRLAPLRLLLLEVLALLRVEMVLLNVVLQTVVLLLPESFSELLEPLVRPSRGCFGQMTVCHGGLVRVLYRGYCNRCHLYLFYLLALISQL